MKCQRCANDKEAEFRVVSDIMDIKVCADCADEARSLGTSLKVVEITKTKSDQSMSTAAARDYPPIMVSGCAH